MYLAKPEETFVERTQARILIGYNKREGSSVLHNNHDRAIARGPESGWCLCAITSFVM